MQMRLDGERMFLEFLKDLESGSMLNRVGGVILLMTIAIAVITGIEFPHPSGRSSI